MLEISHAGPVTLVQRPQQPGRRVPAMAPGMPVITGVPGVPPVGHDDAHAATRFDDVEPVQHRRRGVGLVFEHVEGDEKVD